MTQHLDSIRSNSFYITIANTIVALFGLLSIAIIARYLGPEKQGFIFLVISVVEISNKFAGFGIQAATVFFINSKKYCAEDIINTAVSFSLFSSILVAIIVAMYYEFPLPPDFDVPIDLKAAVFMSLFLASYIVVNFNRLLLVGISGSVQRFDVMNRLNILNIIILFLFIATLAYCDRLTIGNVLSSYLINNVIGLIVAVKEFRKMGFRLRIRHNYLIVKDCLRYGFPIYYNSLLQYFQQRASVFFVASFIGLEAVGYLSVAYVFSDRLSDIASPIVTTHFPVIVDAGQSDQGLIFSITSTVFSRLSAVFFLMIVPFSFLISYLIPFLFSQSYKESIAPAIILSCAVIFLSLSRLLNNVFAALGRQWITSLIFTFSFVFSITATFIATIYTSNIVYVSMALFLVSVLVLIIQLTFLRISLHVDIWRFLPKFRGLFQIVKGGSIRI